MICVFSTVSSVEESSTRMISSTHPRGIPETVASSVFAALRAGIDDDRPSASPLPGGASGSV